MWTMFSLISTSIRRYQVRHSVGSINLSQGYTMLIEAAISSKNSTSGWRLVVLELI
jgi:hypothetical protein